MEKIITLKIPNVAQLINSPVTMGLNDKWDSELLGSMRKEKGIYIFHKKSEILYVGETSGDTMDFQTRLYRHSRKSASPAHNVCLKLKEEFKNVVATVSLIPVEKVRKWFGSTNIPDKNIAKIAEQVLIGLLRPKFQ